MNVVRHLGFTVGLGLPFVEALRDHETALTALPGAAIAGGGLHGLDAGVDGRVFRRYPARKEWDQSPMQPRPQAPALPHAHHRDLLGRSDVEARREFPIAVHEVELALDRGVIG